MFHHVPHIYPCGDHAITLELGDGIDIATNQKILSFFHHVKNHPPEGLLDVIPAYCTLTLVYDTVLLQKKKPDVSAYDTMRLYIWKLLDAPPGKKIATRVIDIPVCYDALLAPDIASLAIFHELTVEEVIRLHTGKTYFVYMLGFLPGFAYMGTVDEKLVTPRKTKPRISVPAGSVGIAGEQTGIYPFDSPGGWQLIGQTPVTLFDASGKIPCYLQPGDEVRFHSISLGEFTKMKKI